MRTSGPRRAVPRRPLIGAHSRRALVRILHVDGAVGQRPVSAPAAPGTWLGNAGATRLGTDQTQSRARRRALPSHGRTSRRARLVDLHHDSMRRIEPQGHEDERRLSDRRPATPQNHTRVLRRQAGTSVHRRGGPADEDPGPRHRVRSEGRAAGPRTHSAGPVHSSLVHTEPAPPHHRGAGRAGVPSLMLATGQPPIDEHDQSRVSRETASPANVPHATGEGVRAGRGQPARLGTLELRQR